MSDLYQRLRELGFDARFLRSTVLPDWWDDALASVPANRAIAESAIARHLGLKIAQLRDPVHKLALPSLQNFRLKRHKDTTASQLGAAVLVGQRVSKLINDNLVDVPAFAGPVTAREVRTRIIEGHGTVALGALVEWCWSSGIAVVHIHPERLPRASKKFEGMAIFEGQRPVIVLASRRDMPPWLAFHLAHELGHVMAGHVQSGHRPLVDSVIDQVDDDQNEREADRFATEVLTGEPKLQLKSAYGLTGVKLADAARRFGTERGIDPGSVALIYGRSANRFGPATLALQRLGQDAGAHKVIADELRQHLCTEDVPESTERFLTCLSISAA